MSVERKLWCCWVDCPAPPTLSIHEGRPGAHPEDYTHACAEHTDALAEGFEDPRRFPIEGGEEIK